MNNNGGERGHEADPRALSPLIVQNNQKLFQDKFDYTDNHQMNAQYQRKVSPVQPDMTPQVFPRKNHFDVRDQRPKFDHIQRNLNTIN